MKSNGSLGLLVDGLETSPLASRRKTLETTTVFVTSIIVLSISAGPPLRFEGPFKPRSCNPMGRGTYGSEIFHCQKMTI